MSDSEALKNELLDAANAAEEPINDEPKPNSKQALINKIHEIASKENIVLEKSNTQLKRMNKKQLAEQLAELIEIGMKRKMARSVGCDEHSDDRAIALGALRMLHDVCAMGLEKGTNAFLDDKGYEVTGFSDALKEPTVSTCIDGCLQEIAEENQELLEYVKSPYTRLAIAWGGALAFSCKRKQKNASVLGPRSAAGANTLRRRGRGRPAPRKINSPAAPTQENVKSV